jgi:hypothetical protein
MSIPKIVHYCWFGRKELPKFERRCIETWRRYLPGYEIMEWNEENFDMNSNSYVREAYEQKKYAFVSDYVRLYALYNYGGIYMDTDVEVLKCFDKLLHSSAFIGFETTSHLSTSVIGAEKQNDFIGDILEYYSRERFVREDGSLNLKTNVSIISEYCKEKWQMSPDGRLQLLANGLTIYPQSYFSPVDYDSGRISMSEDTHSIHHFSASWLPKSKQRALKLRRFIIKTFGKGFYSRVSEMMKRRSK